MDKIRELSKLLDGYKLRNLEVLTNPSNTPNPTRYRQAYETYKAGKWETEEELAELLELEVEGRPFRRFKFEFLKRLYLPVLFIDHEVETLNETQQQHMWCWKQLALFKTLLHRGAIKSATAIAHRLFEVADEYNFPLAGLETATFLKKHYALYEVDREKYQRYQTAAKKYELYFWAENKALEYYSLLMMPFAKSRSSQKELALIAGKLIEELKGYYEKDCNTHVFVGAYFTILILEKMLSYQWQDCLEICNEAIEKALSIKYFSNRILRVFYDNKILCLIRLGKNEEAKELSNLSLKLEPEGTKHWITSQELFILNAFYSREYSNAWEIYTKVASFPEFKLLSNIQKEIWQIYLAYLSLIYLVGKLSPEENVELKSFKFSKFANEVPIFSQDKTGLNIPILILQIFLLLKQKEFDKIEERVEALRKYKTRHFINENLNLRTGYFIQILMLLIKCDFNKKDFCIKSKTIFEKITSIPISIAEQSIEIEIIPYEHLYEWLVEMLL